MGEPVPGTERDGMAMAPENSEFSTHSLPRTCAQVFNSRMCQLVLGAGAMAAAGLRSITAKHLALSAQAAGALMALHPLLRSALAAPVPHARRALLSPDFDRLLQVGAMAATAHRALTSGTTLRMDNVNSPVST